MVITYPIPMWGDSSRVGAHKILMVVQTARMVVQYDVSWRVMVKDSHGKLVPTVGCSVTRKW